MTQNYSETDPADPKVSLDVTHARGARRVGLIWMLIASTALAVIALFGAWAFHAPQLSRANLQDPPMVDRGADVTNPDLPAAR